MQELVFRATLLQMDIRVEEVVMQELILENSLLDGCKGP